MIKIKKIKILNKTQKKIIKIIKKMMSLKRMMKIKMENLK